MVDFYEGVNERIGEEQLKEMSGILVSAILHQININKDKIINNIYPINVFVESCYEHGYRNPPESEAIITGLITNSVQVHMGSLGHGIIVTYTAHFECDIYGESTTVYDIKNPYSISPHKSILEGDFIMIIDGLENHYGNFELIKFDESVFDQFFQTDIMELEEKYQLNRAL